MSVSAMQLLMANVHHKLRAASDFAQRVIGWQQSHWHDHDLGVPPMEAAKLSECATDPIGQLLLPAAHELGNTVVVSNLEQCMQDAEALRRLAIYQNFGGLDAKLAEGVQRCLSNLTGNLVAHTSINFMHPLPSIKDLLADLSPRPIIPGSTFLRLFVPPPPQMGAVEELHIPASIFQDQMGRDETIKVDKTGIKTCGIQLSYRTDDVPDIHLFQTHTPDSALISTYFLILARYISEVTLKGLPAQKCRWFLNLAPETYLQMAVQESDHHFTGLTTEVVKNCNAGNTTVRLQTVEVWNRWLAHYQAVNNFRQN